MSLDSYRASVLSAYRCVEEGNHDAAMWVLADVHDRICDQIEAQADFAHLRRVSKAMELAPTLHIYRLLMAGEPPAALGVKNHVSAAHVGDELEPANRKEAV